MTDLRAHLQEALGTAYTLERELGGGGMSRVFVAEETAYGRRVVVKVLPPDVAAGVNAERFRREIQVAARLLHAHIVPVLTSGEMNGVPYYTMPFVDGESLRARLVRAGPLPITEAIGVLRDIAKALAYAHDHGVVHRDIKPDNILLSGGSASVADFGIAKAISAARTGDDSETLTQIGTSIGTPAYMAPEQAAADPATNHRADIYGFGCVAYEVLAGRPPFVEKSPQRLLAAHMADAPRHIAELRPDTPPELAALVMRCLEKDADTRPQSAAELVKTLETTSGGGHAALPPILLGGAAMLRKALLLYAAAFVAVVIVARAAVIAIGLPDWVVPGAVVVMLMGLPVILFTGYVQRVTRRAVTKTPTVTPGGTASAQHGAGPGGPIASIAMKAGPHVSWNRALRGGLVALGAFVLLVGAFMLLRALGIGPAGSLLAAGRLKRSDPLLLTDFRVVNGDSTLGPVISQAVRSNLEQSAVLSVYSTAKVDEALQRMQRPAGARLDLPLARQLAVREGIKAIVDGEVAGIGSGFLVTLRLVTADSGRELASFRQAADAPTQLIDAVDALSRKLRGRVGESLKAVRASPPLAQATTASVDALRKFTESHRATAAGDFLRSIALLREAIALDTAFVLAYRELAEALSNAELNPAGADSALTHAFRLRDRLPERERQIVTAEYYGTGRGGDRAKAIDAYERALELGDTGNTNSLGNQYYQRRNFARAESLAYLRLRVDPDHGLTFTQLAAYQLAQGKLDAAEATLSAAQTHGQAGHPRAFFQAAAIAVGRDDVPRAIAITDSVQRGATGQQKAEALDLLSKLRLLRGQPRAGARSLAESRRVDLSRGTIRRPSSLDSTNAVFVDAWLFGPNARHVRRLDTAQQIAVREKDVLSKPSQSWAVEFVGEPNAVFTALVLARVYAFVGRPDRARALIRRWQESKRDSVERRNGEPWLNLALAEVALAEHRPDSAIAAYRRADTLSGEPSSGCSACLSINLARAYDVAGNADSTIAALERALGIMHTGKPGIYSLYVGPFEKRLGELWAQKGDRKRAYEHYARFVSLWREAEPELQPMVADVRQRMTRLSDNERR